MLGPSPILPPPLVDPSPSPLHALLGNAMFKAFLPWPVMLLMAPVVYWFFKRTWYELDVDAQRERGALLAEGRVDTRPAVAFVIAALVLTVQEYYGGRQTFDAFVRPLLLEKFRAGATWLHMDRYAELYGFGWWAFMRIAGYVLVPLPLWKLFFPKDSLLDLGLRTRGFRQHAWIYVLCLVVVIPAMILVAKQPDFGTYYPFYKQASRSWFDLILWESMYFAQFFCLEMFFRGWWLGTMRRSLGSGAIFSMAVPYCMIHYGKPYLEANGAIIAGTVLGSLSMKTRSIYAGFLVHITVALSMDLLALWNRHALPTVFFPPLRERGFAVAGGSLLSCGLLSMRRPKLTLSSSSALLAVFTVAAFAKADIYSYTDADGVVHFSNRPSAKGGKGPFQLYMKSDDRKKSSVSPLMPSDTSLERFSRYDEHIRQAATLYQIPEELVRSVIMVESNYDPRVVSPTGAQGLMQLMPGTANRMEVRDSFDPRENIFGGVRYLRLLANLFNGDLELTIAAYNAGEGAVMRHGGIPPYAETQDYVVKVLSYYRRYRATRDVTAASTNAME